VSEPMRIAVLQTLLAVALGLAVGVGVSLADGSGFRSGNLLGPVAGALLVSQFLTARAAFVAGRRAPRAADGSQPPAAGGRL
jgi:hypothetical protein